MGQSSREDCYVDLCYFLHPCPYSFLQLEAYMNSPVSMREESPASMLVSQEELQSGGVY